MNKVLTPIIFSLAIPTICNAEVEYQIELYQYTGNILKISNWWLFLA